MSNITIAIDSTLKPANRFKIKRWVIPADGMRSSANAASFMYAPLWTEKNGFDATVNFQKICFIGGLEEQYLFTIQNPLDGYGFNRDQKVNWLINRYEHPLPTNPFWYKDDWLVYGSQYNSDNVIDVEADTNGKPIEYRFTVKFRAETTKREAVFYKPLGMRKWELSAGYTHAANPQFIHNSTVGYGVDSVFVDHTPKGYVYYPVFDQRDWPCNGGVMYMAAEFLTPL